MKDIRLRLRSSFVTKDPEKLKKAVTLKIEKLANIKLKITG